MDVTSTKDGKTAHVSVSGEVDSDTSPKLEATFAALLTDGVTDFTVDMADASFLSSAGLTVLVAAQRQAERFSLAPGNRIVDRLIALTGLALLYGNDEGVL